MKFMMIAFYVAMLTLVGCNYESPFTKEQGIAIDSKVLGLWEPNPDLYEGKTERDDLLLILKYSENEYLIHYTAEGDGMYFRGYPASLGDKSFVQLQIIGTKDGIIKNDEMKLFYAVSYRLTGDGLEVKTLNTDLVDDDLSSTEELRKAFLKHKANEDLFRNPKVFRKKQ